jgi:hypothetical protein
MGRPTKLDDIILVPTGKKTKEGKQEVEPRRLADVVIERVRAGAYPEDAAISVGVDRATFYRWKQRGRPRVLDSKVLRADPVYRDFCDALDRARAEARVLAVASIRAAFSKDWRAAVTYLERTDPAHWRRRESHYVAGPGEGDPEGGIPINLEGRVKLGGDTLDRLGQVLDILDGAGALPRRDPPTPPHRKPPAATS